MSEVKVNKISPRSGTTVTLGDSGDTFTLASGVSLTGVNATFSGDLTVDTDTLYVDSTNNRVGIGTSSPSTTLHILTDFGNGILLEDNDAFTATPNLTIIGKRADGNGSQSFAGKIRLARNETVDSISGSGDNLGTVMFGGNHTNSSISNILYAASISGISEGVFNSSTDMPTGIAFYTGSTGRDGDTANVSSGSEAMRIDSSGNVGIGTSSITEKLEVAGDIRLQNALKFRADDDAENGAISLSDSDELIISSFGASGHITLKTGSSNTERMRIDSSGHAIIPNGVTLGTAVGTYNAANTLDDYEEGTWTPVIQGGTTAGTGTYTTQQGIYTKVGNIVTVSCWIDWSAHTGTGNFLVYGLPFSAALGPEINLQPAATYGSNFDAGTSATQLIAYPTNGSTFFSFRGFVNNALRTIPQIQASGLIGVTATYRVE